ncbi:unnamed protein product [Prorocentrum cordatum]|uniref:Protein kinase domain-containing protein n=1 Tax=Prorocentrum cordatum TaxID=2364126 RepID=A0ABN9QWN4_9DINO|nr:unnamed protein product [Polarella glacialis]
MVPFNVLGIVALTTVAAIGKRAFERQESARCSQGCCRRSRCASRPSSSSPRWTWACTRRRRTSLRALHRGVLPEDDGQRRRLRRRSRARRAGRDPRHRPAGAVAHQQWRSAAPAWQGTRRGGLRHRRAWTVPRHRGGGQGSEAGRSRGEWRPQLLPAPALQRAADPSPHPPPQRRDPVRRVHGRRPRQALPGARARGRRSPRRVPARPAPGRRGALGAAPQDDSRCGGRGQSSRALPARPRPPERAALPALETAARRRPRRPEGLQRFRGVAAQREQGVFVPRQAARLWPLAAPHPENAKSLGGTLRWLPPELLARPPPDATADCYSFGLLMYFIVTERLPYEGKSADQVLKRLRRGQLPTLRWPAPLGDLGHACRPLVEQCTQLKPALRPTVQQVSDELSLTLSHVAGGAAEAALENIRAGSADAAGSDELQEFAGVVEVRQASSSSLGSWVHRLGSGDLPPVQEHEVLVSGEAPDSAAAPPPRTSREPRKARREPASLVHPGYRPTPLSTQTLTLAYLLLQWNVQVPGSACCWLHGILRAVERVHRELRRRPCSQQLEGAFSGQCGQCDLMLPLGTLTCEFCECPGGSGGVAQQSSSSEAIVV